MCVLFVFLMLSVIAGCGSDVATGLTEPPGTTYESPEGTEAASTLSGTSTTESSSFESSVVTTVSTTSKAISPVTSSTTATTKPKPPSSAPAANSSELSASLAPTEVVKVYDFQGEETYNAFCSYAESLRCDEYRCFMSDGLYIMSFIFGEKKLVVVADSPDRENGLYTHQVLSVNETEISLTGGAVAKTTSEIKEALKKLSA